MKILNPCPQLRHYVKCYYLFEHPIVSTELMFPASSCPYIKVSSNSIILSGQATHPIKACIDDMDTGLSFSLNLGGIFALTGIPSNHVTDKVLNFQDVIHSSTDEVINRISMESSPAKKISQLESFLISLLCPNISKKHERIEIVRALNGTSFGSIRRTAQELGLSARHLQRIMNEYVGYSPRFLQKILRFEKVVEHLLSHRQNFSWSALSYDFGFSDQSHLIRDFKEFTGYTPAEYLNRLGMSDSYNTKWRDLGIIHQ
jgi:AraC-like DNA-binding protein